MIGPSGFMKTPNQPTLFDPPKLDVERLLKGIVCDCCGNKERAYRRKISGAMARDLIRLYNMGEGYHSVNEICRGQIGDFPKLRYWGLIEAQPGERQDGSKRNGYWRITEAGRLFVEFSIAVPYKLVIFRGVVISRKNDIHDVTIYDCLGTKFNYDELINDV